MTAELPLFAACLPGLEPLLAAELRRLSAAPTELPGGCAFTGDRELLLAAHLHLGTASHLLLRCATFRCLNLAELRRKVAALPFGEWLPAGGTVAVRATARKSRLYHSGAIEQRVALGLHDALGAQRDDVAGVPIAVRVLHDEVTLSIDTAAEPLHRRGYRLATAKAPLREDLAHALLLAAELQPDEAVADPFCGSGTIAIEAARLLAGVPPGALRPTPAAGLRLADPVRWRQLVAAAVPRTAPPVLGSDRDAGAITAARDNGSRAQVDGRVQWQVAPLSDCPWLLPGAAAPDRILFATNPPFGHRIAPGRDLGNLYQTLGHRVGQRAGARLCLLAHDVRLARRCGLPLRVLFSTRIGGLQVSALRS